MEMRQEKAARDSSYFPMKDKCKISRRMHTMNGITGRIKLKGFVHLGLESEPKFCPSILEAIRCHYNYFLESQIRYNNRTRKIDA